MKSNLTIAIVTKGRPIKLAKCLQSISKQTILPDKIIVIDNDEHLSAQQTVKKYTKKLTIQHISNKRNGVPIARNIALNIVKTKYLGFVDDDCILNKTWVSSALKVLNSDKKISYVSGNTYLYNDRNTLALAQYTRDKYWFMKHLKKNNVTTPVHFDTKNVVIDRLKIIRNDLWFDPRCSIDRFDSADFDFGIQIGKKFLIGKYVKSMVLKHEETTALQRYLLRGYTRGKIAAYIKEKWKMEDQLVDLSESNIFIWVLKSIKKYPNDFRAYAANLKISLVEKLLLVVATRAYEGAYLMGYLSYNKPF